MADHTTLKRSRSRTRSLAAWGLLAAWGPLLGLAWVTPCCGGEAPPSPGPKAPSGQAPAAEPAADPAPQVEGPATGGSGKRFDVATEVTAAPAGTAADAPATLRGVARLLGKVPEPQRIAMGHIGGCREHEDPMSETVVATESGELQNVVVYVTRGIDRDTLGPAPAEPVVLVQEGCVFVPHISVVRAGQTLQIHNADNTNHNINARPAHGSNAAFNKMQPPAAADLEEVFARAEIAIPLGCDVHPWMKAWVAVVDHPYYSVSDETGAWSIELPPGDYLVEAWHERYGTLKGSAKVAAGEVASFAFSFEGGKKRN